MITSSRSVKDTFLTQEVDTPESRELWELFEEEEEREELDVYETYNGEMVIGTHFRIEKTGWGLLAEMGEKEAFEPIGMLTRTLLYILAGFSVLGMTLAILISRRITRPIVELRKATDHIMKGDLDYRVGTKARDEVGELSRSFDSMTAELKRSKAQVAEYSKGLEQKVKERTKELNKSVKESEEQRLATLNLLNEKSETRSQKPKIGGPGSAFHFTARFGLSRKEAREATRLPELDLSGVRVLIVDDNATRRLVFQEMTFSWGLVPTQATDGKEALAKIKRAFDSGKPYQLLLLDLQMPGMDGFEVAKRAKEDPSAADAEIILLTSMGQRGDASLCRELGISGYLVKPVKRSDLLDAIMMAMGRTDVKTPVITRHIIQEARSRLDILLAEDNIVNQQLATKMLEKRGHRVVVASNGKEAIEKLEGESCDLILMDIQMPEMDGLTDTREIRNLKSEIRNIPIVAMTAHAMKGYRETCIEAGMDDYITKPIKVDELFRVIEKLANNSS